MEEGQKIYSTVKREFNLREFQQTIKPDGLNPYLHQDEYNPNIQIDDIIKEHFRKLENIDPDIMSTYIDTEHRFINEFNH